MSSAKRDLASCGPEASQLPPIAKKRLRLSYDSSYDVPATLPPVFSTLASSFSTGDARSHTLGRDVISLLPDELVIRVFSFMTDRELLNLSLVSRRFHTWSCDSELWRKLFFRRFILPRVHLIPGYRKSRFTSAATHPATVAERATAWNRSVAAADKSSDAGSDVDWKRNYKTKHNWGNGSCGVDEMPMRGAATIASAAAVAQSAMERTRTKDEPRQVETIDEPRVLGKAVDGLVFTLDGDSGLRAWDTRTRKLLAQIGVANNDDGGPRPTCLAVDDGRISDRQFGVAVGFEDGSFGIWNLATQEQAFSAQHRSGSPRSGTLIAMAYSWPYLFMATQDGVISLYDLDSSQTIDRNHSGSMMASNVGGIDGSTRHCSPPRRLTSLKSHSTHPPLALSIRRTPNTVVASIAYSFDSVGGWCIGIQDLDIHRHGPDGLPRVETSRLAYTTPPTGRQQRRRRLSPYHFRRWSTPKTSWPAVDGGRLDQPQLLGDHDADEAEGCDGGSTADDGPIRLSYSHPYLLVTLPDNTMALHICTATANSLTLSPEIRLWGHTSGISDAEITSRGKAVSISTRGDEIRVWELEGKIVGNHHEASVEVRPRTSDNGADATSGAIISRADPIATATATLHAATTESSRAAHSDGVGREAAEDEAKNAVVIRAGGDDMPELDSRKNWVGFNNEVVVVMKSLPDGQTALKVYDFT